MDTGLEILYNFTIVVIAVVVVLYVWKFKWCQRRILAAASQLPGPLAIPLLGNTYLSLGGVEKVTKKLNDLSPLFVGVSCFWLGPIPLFIVSDPEDLKVILNSKKTLEKDDGYEFLKPFLGNGLITAPVNIWKRNHRLLNPVFTQKNVEETIPIMNITSKNLTETFISTGEKEINVFKYILPNLAESASRSILGLKEGVAVKMASYIEHFIQRISTLLLLRFTNLLLAFDSLFFYMYKKDIDEFHSTAETAVHEILRQDCLVTNTTKDLVSDETKDCKYDVKNFRDILMDLMQKDPSFTEQDFFFELITSMGPAGETTGVTLSFCLLTLAKLQHIQNKLYLEIHNTFGNSERDMTKEDLNNMPYLDCVMKEVLRRYRPIPFVARKATEDIKLSTCTIPAGSRVVININGLHMNPAHYPDPLVFDPDRFSPENDSKRHPYSFLPFSGGPRGCIGKHYAICLMKVTLVNILRRFKLSTTMDLEDIVYVIHLSMGSKTGFPVKFIPRK